MADAGLVLEAGGDYGKLEADTNRALTSVVKQLNQASGQLDKFEKKLAGMGKTFNGKKVVNELHSIQDALNKINPADAEKALAKMFDSSRLALIQAGGTRLRLFGSALEPLGPIGIAAAAGVVAAGVAIDQAIKFTGKAAEIERTAKALGMTTTQVQELGHVATALNIDPGKLDESLKQLNAHLGALDTNLLRGKQLQAFTKEIGIPPEQLRSWGTLDQQLPHILESLSRLSAQARAAFAARMGMDPEVLNTLVEARGRYSDLVAEAHRYGLVIDEDVIRKGAAANAELKTASDVISTRLTVAFADLAPVIVDVANALAQAIGKLDQFIGEFKKIPDRTTVQLRMDKADLEGRMAESRKWYPGIDTAKPPNYLEAGGSPAHPFDASYAINYAEYQRDKASLAQVNQSLSDKKLITGVHDLMDSPGGATPVVPGKTPHAKADHSATQIDDAELHYLEALEKGAKDLEEAHRIRLLIVEAQYTLAQAHAAQEAKGHPATLTKLLDTAKLTHDADVADENQRYAKAQADHTRSFTDQLAKLQEGQLEAQADITGQLADRQAAERQRLLDEQAAARTDLSTENADKKRTAAESAKLTSLQAAEQKAQIDAQTTKQARETADEETKAALRGLDFDHQRLEAMQKLAKTQDERRSLAEQLLANEKQAAELKLGQQARDENFRPGQAADARAALGLDFQAKGAAVQAQYAGPFAKFAADNQAGNLGTDLQDNALTAMQTLNSGLADLVSSSQRAREELKKLPEEFAMDVIKSLLKTGEGSIIGALTKAASSAGAPQTAGYSLGGGLAQQPGGGAFGSSLGIVGSLFHLFGFAGGTGPSGAPGGLAVVGERGREIVNLPRGASVTPNVGIASALSGALKARGAGTVNVSLTSSYDLRGVSGDRTIDQKIAAAHEANLSETADMIYRIAPAAMSNYQTESG